MKKIFLLTALAVLLGIASASAQQIAVVSESGETTVYQTFEAAINGSEPSSVIYLPGGGFPISDDLKITKPLTIIGIGHKSNNDNVDGNTKIIGNLWFNEGSSSSAVLGCHISGNVIIGDDGASVNFVMVKCCNLNSIQVKNSTCMGIFINQNYIRSASLFNQSNATITNNIIHSIYGVNNGSITYNILASYYYHTWGGGPGVTYYEAYDCITADNTQIKNNIIIPKENKTTHPSTFSQVMYRIFCGSNNVIINNLLKLDLGEDPMNIGDVDWNDFFVGFNNGAISPASNFHLQENYLQYENIYGIYGGTYFDDHQTASVPYIVAKRIDEQTDASGHLGIRIRVKAGEHN